MLQNNVIRYNTLNVPRGKNYALTLPDGTRVRVNALSQLKFPSSFSGNAKRQVELKGEGYFEVARDTAHPFEVKTAQQTIIVTGTSFNISAYENETNRTTLCSGKVIVETPQGEQIPLSPGQQVATDLSGKTEIMEVDTDIYTAWLKGIYYFDEKTLTEVFKELSKWFDISEVNYIDPALEERLFSGKLKKADGLEVILQVIEQGSRSKITNDKGHLKIEIKELGSVLLSLAFTMSRVVEPPTPLLVDFVPLRVSLVFTLPIPVRYRLAPALVLTVPFSRDNFIPSESEVKRRVSSANSGSFTVTFCADALVSVARAMTNDKNNFFICNDILLLYICKDT